MATQTTPISEPVTISADSAAVLVPFPKGLPSQTRVAVTVHESAGPIELVGAPDIVKGLTIPTTLVTNENYRAGVYNAHAKIYAHAPAATPITFVFVVLPNE